MRETMNLPNIYVSDALLGQLSEVRQYPVTLIEAASGYGKTSTVQAYFHSPQMTGEEDVYWISCRLGSVPQLWTNLRSVMMKIDPYRSADLMDLEPLNLSTIHKLSAILSGFVCLKETFVVIDDYEQVDSELFTAVVREFLKAEVHYLHIIVISRYFDRSLLATKLNHHLNIIPASSFRCDKGDIARIFRAEGVSLSSEEINRVYEETEGWIAAIAIYADHYKRNGRFPYQTEMKELIEQKILSALSKQEQDFLLAVSIMERFNLCQAATIFDGEELTSGIMKLIDLNTFICYDSSDDSYHLHWLLKEYLLSQFSNHMPLEHQTWAMLRVAAAYESSGDYRQAAKLYYELKDYPMILQLPLTAQYISNEKENGILELIQKVVMECPDQILMEYPFALLMYCSQMFAGGYFGAYRKLYDLIQKFKTERVNVLAAEEQLRFNSEYKFISIVSQWANQAVIDRMMQLDPDDNGVSLNDLNCYVPFGYGCPSLLFFYWQETGKLAETIQDAEQNYPLYRKFIGAYGAGAEYILQAEALLMRGEDTKAEFLARKAIYQAKLHHQIPLCISAEVGLARIALLRNDLIAFQRSIRFIKEYGKQANGTYMTRMVELCLSLLNIIAGKQEIAGWLNDLDQIRNVLYYFAVPYAQIFYAINLFNKQDYTSLIGFAEAMLDLTNELNTRFLMPRLYYYKYLALVNYRIGQYVMAMHYFKQALEIALPDRVLLPLAQDRETLELINLVRSSVSDKQGLDELKRLCFRFQAGTDTLRKSEQNTGQKLTPREREVALLIQQRYTATEIAEMLFISKATVKTIIKNIYSKLDIHSRSELESITLKS